MKTGQTLVALATEIQRQAESKRDFIAPSTELAMEIVGGSKPWEPNAKPKQAELKINIKGSGHFGIKQTAHDQFAARLGIPAKYYDRLRTEAPSLLVHNVNHWFNQAPDRRLVRTLDGNVRAFLSDRYRPLDNLDLAETVLPIIQGNGCRVESSALTESRLYIKAVTERITTEIRKGDIVQSGIVISNSEVGMGSIKVEPMVFRVVCLNGMIANDHAMRKYHVGRGNGEGDFAQEFFRDETRQADDRAFWLKVRDVVAGSFKQDVFEAIVNSMRAATEKVITGDLIKVVEVTQRKFGLNENERGGVLKHLIQGGDLTQYGLMNAVTRASQDSESYDRATDLERLGGQIIELPNSEWKYIAEAA